MTALAQLSAALDALVAVVDGGALEELGREGLLGFLQDFERVRSRLSVVDHAAIGACEVSGTPDALAMSMRKVLVHLLRLSPGEAGRRVSAAQACGPRRSVVGAVLAPLRPVLAAAQRAGEASAEQVAVIDRALAQVDRPGFDPQQVDAGERLLTEFAACFPVADLRRLATRTAEAIDPDGSVPDEQLVEDRRHFTIRRRPDGSYTGDFRLTGPVGAKLTALLSSLSRPRLDPGREPGGAGSGVDGRTFGQRTHDAIGELCDRVLRAGSVPGSLGTPATVIVTMTLEALQARSGSAVTSDGAGMSVGQVLELAREAEVIPAVLDHHGAVLALGRSRRIASHTQTLALVARDRGCSFPGCDRPPEWCERHHMVAWVDGGATDLDNLTLLCRYHHHNFAARGWSCRLSVDGLPEWRPPRWVDRQQRPLMNGRILAELLTPPTPQPRLPPRTPVLSSGPENRKASRPHQQGTPRSRAGSRSGGSVTTDPDAVEPADRELFHV